MEAGRRGDVLVLRSALDAGAAAPQRGGGAGRALTSLIGRHRRGDASFVDPRTDGGATIAAEAIPQISPVLAGGNGYAPVFNGVNYVADVYGSYADANSLSSLSPNGVNAVALTADYGINAETNTVYADTVAGGYTESDSNVAATIQNATTDGLSVMVRPLLDFLPANYDGPADATNPKNGSYSASEFRAYYNPGAANSATANSFFASYQTMIVNEARVAQANGAGLFCIGVELDQITGSAYETYWDNIISAVRAVFSGRLTYSALWDDSLSPWQYGPANLAVGTGDITTQVSFWNKLDYVGIDGYAPISDNPNPTVQQLINGWTQTPTDQLAEDVTGDQSLISYFESISAALAKPLLFTELGYANSSDAAINPATPGYDQDGNPDNAAADPTLQANLYTAFFDAWQQDGNGSLAGTYLWNWEPGGAGISPFSVQGLPAEQAVATGYTACYAEGTRIATPSGAMPIERLRADDVVLTAFGGPRPVVWVGRRRVRFAANSLRPQPHPIRVRQDAFAAGKPCRDLVLSPDHAVFVDGALIPIRHLQNGGTILRETVSEIVYWHVELPTHDILLADGLPAESWPDTGNRAAFDNAGITSLHANFDRDPARVWAEQSCAKLVEDGPLVDAVRTRLAARADLLGRALPIALDVALSHLGSIRVDAPAGVDLVRLLSPARRPPGDGRRLGALVAGISIDGLMLDFRDVRLADGFHQVETIGAAPMRWTDGAATLAIGRASSPRVLRMNVAMLAASDGRRRCAS